MMKKHLLGVLLSIIIIHLITQHDVNMLNSLPKQINDIIINLFKL